MKTLKKIIIALMFAAGGIIVTTEQQHVWQTLVGVTFIMASVPLINRFEDDPEKYPEE